MTIETRDIAKTEIGCIKPLWEELNRIHLADSVYFKKHYSAFTFEKRMEALLARIRALLRRAGGGAAKGTLTYRDLSMDQDALRGSRGGGASQPAIRQ